MLNMYMQAKMTGWFHLGKRVVENDGYFVRLSDGVVYAWTRDAKLI